MSDTTVLPPTTPEAAPAMPSSTETPLQKPTQTEQAEQQLQDGTTVEKFVTGERAQGSPYDDILEKFKNGQPPLKGDQKPENAESQVEQHANEQSDTVPGDFKEAQGDENSTPVSNVLNDQPVTEGRFEEASDSSPQVPGETPAAPVNQIEAPKDTAEKVETPSNVTPETAEANKAKLDDSKGVKAVKEGEDFQNRLNGLIKAQQASLGRDLEAEEIARLEDYILGGMIREQKAQGDQNAINQAEQMAGVNLSKEQRDALIKFLNKNPFAALRLNSLVNQILKAEGDQTKVGELTNKFKETVMSELKKTTDPDIRIVLYALQTNPELLLQDKELQKLVKDKAKLGLILFLLKALGLVAVTPIITTGSEFLKQ